METSNIILASTITCSDYQHQKEETMPTDACQLFYECENYNHRAVMFFQYLCKGMAHPLAKVAATLFLFYEIAFRPFLVIIDIVTIM